VIGLPELIGGSLPDYERLACRLATERPWLAEIKTRLARNRSTSALFDTVRFRRHIEVAYTTMYERYLRGVPPAAIAVAPIDQT